MYTALLPISCLRYVIVSSSILWCGGTAQLESPQWWEPNVYTPLQVERLRHRHMHAQAHVP
ncbi:MAG: hypothetical protein Q8L02_05065 [Candidatus Nitrotoga sp.]|nr:hypothetical protein [Candidatus Nitrotoga sp.]